MGNSVDTCSGNNMVLEKANSGGFQESSSEEYAQFQRRIFMATIIFSACAVAISAIFFDLQTSLSLLFGAFFGLLYLRLLARSIEKLGTSSKQVGKIQLIAPVLVVLVSSKLPQIDLIPAILGFLFYKPSLIFQMILETRFQV